MTFFERTKKLKRLERRAPLPVVGAPFRPTSRPAPTPTATPAPASKRPMPTTPTPLITGTPQGRYAAAAQSAVQRSKALEARKKRPGFIGPILGAVGKAVQSGGKTAEQLAAEFLAAHGGGGGGGGTDEIALAREQARLQAEADAASRAFQSEQDRIQREFQAQQEQLQREQERQIQAVNLQAQRQQTYVDLIGRDPARAILFALGYGPEHDAFNTQAQTLGITLEPLLGAAGSAKMTAEALSKLLGGQVSFGQFGIQGLGSPLGAARQFAQGGADVQKLLASAFGVGSTAPGEQPGISPERLVELLSQVIPTGTLQNP